jgi:WD40 repeat protein
MLTASGDQTLGLWDTGHADILGSFRGHSGSVKAVAPMPDNNAVFASGGRRQQAGLTCPALHVSGCRAVAPVAVHARPTRLLPPPKHTHHLI